MPAPIDMISNPFNLTALKIRGTYDICLDINRSDELIIYQVHYAIETQSENYYRGDV